MQRFLVGVDEAGRGPLAGPVSVGIVVAPVDFDIKVHIPNVADSKKLSEKKREEIYLVLQELVVAGRLRFCVEFSTAQMIDSVGIVSAVHSALYKGVRSLAPDPSVMRVLLDGSLHAPEEYEQQTIIRGDQSEPIISLASIAAKVERDRLMQTFGGQYPEYGFEVHKGYGTKMHYAAIQKYGLSDIHRHTFC